MGALPASWCSGECSHAQGQGDGLHAGTQATPHNTHTHAREVTIVSVDFGVCCLATQGYAFVEFRTEEDADYTVKVAL